MSSAREGEVRGTRCIDQMASVSPFMGFSRRISSNETATRQIGCCSMPAGWIHCTAFPPGNRSMRPVTRSRKSSEEHTSELQSLMRISYAVFCWKKKQQYDHEVAPTYL